MARKLLPLLPLLALPETPPTGNSRDEVLLKHSSNPEDDIQQGRPAITPLDVPMLARKRSKRMLAVLEIIARDDKKPAAARVTAAKALLDLAKMDSALFKSLDDQTVMELAERVIAKRDARLAKVVKRQVNEADDADLPDDDDADAELPQ